MSISTTPSAERAALTDLVSLKHRLMLLRRTTDSISTPAINQIYSEVNEKVKELLSERDKEDKAAEASKSAILSNGESANEDASPYSIRSRVNDVINTIYQIISLFWMALGKNREPPATYIQLVTLKRSLTVLDESGVYTTNDIKPYETRLNELMEIIKQTPAGNMPSGLELLIQSVSKLCEFGRKLKQTAEEVNPILLPIQTKLVNLRNRLSCLVADEAEICNEEVIQQLQRELREIDSQRKDGKFVAPDGSILKDRLN
ncbi:hypothetical protein BDF19DRAFT_466692 [Syncephalis fuscata]|nr:hypothetical protein BDF19DRAFT_466692 [Syncephalis fuscata]